MKNLIICLVFTFGALLNIKAQVPSGKQGIQYTKPVEDLKKSTEADRAIIYILSPNKDINISHSMGKSLGVIKDRDDESYLYIYKLEHIFSEDDIEDGFFKTTLEISSVYGEKTSPMILKAGKCYSGYFEVPFSFSYKDETTEHSFYAADNKAKVSFISEVNDLYISCNNKLFVKDGVAVQPEVEVKIENGLSIYDFIFDTKTLAEEFKRPKFKVRSSFHEELDVELGEGKLISPKSYYQFRIIIANTIFETEYAQLLRSAEDAEKASDFSSAKSFYEQANAADSLSELQRAGLISKISRMTECHEEFLKAKSTMVYIRTLIKSGDLNKQKLEDAWEASRICYSNLAKLTGNSDFIVMVEKIEEKMESFNYIYVSGTVRNKMSSSVISEGVHIYTTSRSQMSASDLKSIKDKDFVSHDKVGVIGADGKFSFRVDKDSYSAKGLVFIPQGDNKKYKSFLSLAKQEDIKTTVYIYTK